MRVTLHALLPMCSSPHPFFRSIICLHSSWADPDPPVLVRCFEPVSTRYRLPVIPKSPVSIKITTLRDVNPSSLVDRLRRILLPAMASHFRIPYLQSIFLNYYPKIIEVEGFLLSLSILSSKFLH